MPTLFESLESEEKIKKDFNKKTDILIANLKGFMDLCQRVNKVHPFSPLEINFEETNVEGRSIKKEIRIRPCIPRYDDSNYSYEITHSINFLYVASNDFFIELISRNYYGGDESIWHLLYRKKIQIEELVSWNDENKMKLINWLNEDNEKSRTRVVNAKDFYCEEYWQNFDHFSAIDYVQNSVHIEYLRFLSIPTEYLPGKIDAIPDFDCRTHFPNIYKKLKTEENNLKIINEWQFGRIRATRINQLNEQVLKIHKLRKQIVEIGDILKMSLNKKL